MSIFEHEIKKLFESKGIIGIPIEIPPNPQMGDYAVPCFTFAKTLKKAPFIISQDLAESFSSSLFEKIIATGPYVNFFVNPAKLSEETLRLIHKEKEHFGKSNMGSQKKVMIEFSSPNTNKPLHLGHVRNILLGESLSRIYQNTGHHVIRACLVNDRGVHICKSMLAYKNWGDNSEPDKKSDHFVGDWYVRFSKEAKDDPELEKKAQEMLVRWENHDHDTVRLWEKMNKWVYDGFNMTYKSLGIKFDNIYYESRIYDKGKELVLEGFKDGIFEKDDKGNIVAPLKKHGVSENKVVLRADGTAIYITQDIYLAKQKIEDHKLDKSFYVVGSEQNLHFQQLFKIVELLGLTKAENLKHISYGMVYLPEGKMKSREGTVVDADDLISEVISLAREEVKNRYEGLSDDEIESRSGKIGLGALKLFILKMDPAKDMTYNPKESVSFEGETGPYVQYAYARINSIFEKGEIEKATSHIDYSVFDDSEKQIIKKLAEYPHVVNDAAASFKPSLIARHSLDLSQMFNEYYHSHRVLGEAENIRNARLLLLDCIRITLKNSLHLLGIDAPEKM